MALISVTRLRLRSPRYLLPFFWDAILTQFQAQRAPGNLKLSTHREPPLAFWTLTAWDSADSMRKYMTSGAHRKAMPKLMEWCDEASVLSWEQDSPDLPDWETAMQRMAEQGRCTKLPHPSPAQAAKQGMGVG